MAKKINTNSVIPEEGVFLPAFLIKSAVPFPGVPLPYPIENEEEEKILKEFMDKDEQFVITALRSPEKGYVISNIISIGVMAKVMRIIELPDGQKNAFLMCEERVKVVPQKQYEFPLFNALVFQANDRFPVKLHKKFETLMGILTENYDFVKDFFQEQAHVQMSPPREMQENPIIFLSFMIATSPFSHMEKVELLCEDNIYERAQLALEAIERVKEQIELRKEIFAKASTQLDQEQREHFLRQQIRTIQNEIGEGEDNEINRLEEKAKEMNWPAEMHKVFQKEIAKLRRYNPSSPDYAVAFSYIETLLSLPWNNVSESEIDLVKLGDDLDKDHYGMEKIKERIMEYVAVLKLRGDMRSPILCLYGPPGVGKTSLCKSIADSIGRDYARVSLGGLHDETQIRGHRRTYIGALPGRIITALSKIGHNNPVFVLDEVDKIGNDHHGDPAQALLEVLDPEQNNKFHDNYLDVDYDLSKVFFIATANDLSTISAPLLDRMELIEVSGYLLEEKIEIARRHLIPKLLESHGFKRKEIKFTDDAIQAIIESYTRESGVRKLEKTLASVLRKLALKKARGEKFKKTLTRKDVKALLGKENIQPESYDQDLPVGVVAGLAWTPVGGEILYFESSLSKGKGQLSLTGNLGDIMKESATLALQWIKANADKLGIDPERFASTDVHLHVPEGAVPKDGPSAGITMVCSLVSSFTQKRVKGRIAMTGEISLRGKVLPVGGVKEKILAAKRAGISDIILSAKNKPDIDEIPSQYLEGLRFHFVADILEVIGLTLE